MCPSQLRIRTRGPELYEAVKLGTQRTYSGTTLIGTSEVYSPSGMVVLQESCMDYTNPGPPYRTGGPLFLKRYTRSYKNSDAVRIVAYWYGGARYEYDGCYGCYLQIDPTGSIYGEYNNYAPTAADFGATGWNKFRPLKPKADLGQFIGELRDFPRLFKVGLRKFKDLGNLYLNYNFGWKPFISDVRKAFNLMSNLEATIRRIRKYNGKWQKRGGLIRNDFDSQVDETNVVKGWLRLIPQNVTLLENTTVPVHKRVLTVTSDRIWFEGAMKYYIPDLEKDGCKSIFTSPLVRYLYGLNVTPSLLWELTPWSWLADWVGNIGDVLSNMNTYGSDNLVARYAYVMRHRRKTIQYEESKTVGTPNKRVSASAVVTAECKERAAASPFGFAVTADNVSPYQLSILAALGMTRFLK